MTLNIDPLTSRDDLEWCARVMAENEPWRTLKRDYGSSLDVLSNPLKERYVVRADGSRVGLLILDMTGPFPGYIQTIGIAPEARNRGIGRRAHFPREPQRVYLRVVVQSRCPTALRATGIREDRRAQTLHRR